MKLFRLLCATLVVSSVLGCGSKTPESVVESYLKANTWEERAKYVLDADRVKPAMEKRYSKDYEPIEKFKVNPPKQIKDQWVGVDTVIWGKNLLGAESSNTNLYYLQKTNAGYKVDWEASVGFNSMTAAAFKAQRPKEPIKFRLIGKLSDRYYYIPWDRRNAEKSLWSVALNDGDENSLAYGYIEKESEDGKRLYEILKDGEEHRLTLTIKWLEDSRPDDKVVIIEKFVCNGWLDK